MLSWCTVLGLVFRMGDISDKSILDVAKYNIIKLIGAVQKQKNNNPTDGFSTFLLKPQFKQLFLRHKQKWDLTAPTITTQTITTRTITKIVWVVIAAMAPDADEVGVGVAQGGEAVVGAGLPEGLVEVEFVNLSELVAELDLVIGWNS